MAPQASLITFSCYGLHLHGDARGSVDRFHNAVGARYVDADAGREAYMEIQMTHEEYQLDRPRRIAVLESFVDCCRHRNWILEAAHVRTTHVHLVTATDLGSDDSIERFKTNASWFLRKRFEEPKGTRRWADGGSCRRLLDQRALSEAITYVLHKQGEPMEVYENRQAR